MVCSPREFVTGDCQSDLVHLFNYACGIAMSVLVSLANIPAHSYIGEFLLLDQSPALLRASYCTLCETNAI
ncbi:hypothetical protein HBI56_221730 [Parastagonospora nodorum]|nr:hypothetical protein HBI06_222500 [Parastagonospora nodorum]KAH4226164.1 hypothetical protein HBI05_224170 [Parastagonospora nodorum]KAH4335511.1 hypothetical protein HBH98_234680 [Parastagonospora nodorum]KAH4358203.1 hypothetical protein HBH97_219130 [Parastagonospora nodorum]KAH4372390.1 hypothetical protein HBH99_230800 [Parastagonospora nodorum]